MKNAFFFLSVAIAMLSATKIMACGGCMDLSIREIQVAETSLYQHIFAGKVIKLETKTKAEYKKAAAAAKKHLHGYGSKDSEVPSFETKLTIQLTKTYKGKLAGEQIELLVKPTLNESYCNYFHFKNNQEYIFFLEDGTLETNYYALVYHANVKDYTKADLGWTDAETAEKIHKETLEMLQNIATAKEGQVLKFYNWEQTLYAEGRMQNGQMEGEWTFYHYTEAGKTPLKSQSGSYKNGLRVGEWRNFDAEGGLIQREVFETDERTGRVLLYIDEFLLSDRSLKDGIEHGKQVYYYWASKQISQVSYFVDGQAEGEWIFYDESGNVIDKKIYKKGEVVDL